MIRHVVLEKIGYGRRWRRSAQLEQKRLRWAKKHCEAQLAQRYAAVRKTDHAGKIHNGQKHASPEAAAKESRQDANWCPRTHAVIMISITYWVWRVCYSGMETCEMNPPGDRKHLYKIFHIRLTGSFLRCADHEVHASMAFCSKNLLCIVQKVQI